MTTLEDVAKKAKVSTMTVSRILNNPASVKPATRERVEKIIKEMNYRPNMLAKSLVRGSSRTIGVIYSSIYNQAYLDMITGINEVSYRNDYCIMSTNVDNYTDAVKSFEMLIGNQIDGIIILPMEMAMSTRKDFSASIAEMGDFYHYLEKVMKDIKLPALTISQKCEGMNNISFDFVKQAEITMDYLMEQGKQNIAMISSPFQDGLWLEKEKVYRRKMEEADLGNFIRIERQNATVQGGHLAMDRICSGPLPDAVYCANDILAVGALQSAWSNGCRVPDDLSVIGNDDIPLSEMTYPRLTTVSLNSNLAGQTAIQMLLKRIGGEEIEDVVMTHYMVIRESVSKTEKSEKKF